VICIGRNYVEHIHELNNEIPSSMVIFNKPNSAITDTLHFITPDTRFEGEICFLMMGGEIAGVGFGLDLTKGELQNHLKSKGLPWERAKGFDRSAVLSDFVPLRDPLESLWMSLHINDTLVQEATYELMIYKPLEMVREIQSFMSIEEGDVIMSGTPKGVNTYAVGERFVGRIFSDEKLLLEAGWCVH
jgi:2-keto-4-pentenoate hydratase/2-oxohepta-3-ene-1,7-dioic acid hydratase in catechol pathway